MWDPMIPKKNNKICSEMKEGSLITGQERCNRRRTWRDFRKLQKPNFKRDHGLTFWEDRERGTCFILRTLCKIVQMQVLPWVTWRLWGVWNLYDSTTGSKYIGRWISISIYIYIFTIIHIVLYILYYILIVNIHAHMLSYVIICYKL